MRISDPTRERAVLSYATGDDYNPLRIHSVFSIYKACEDLYGSHTLGRDFVARVRFHENPVTGALIDRHRVGPFTSRYRAGLYLGYQIYKILPVHNLRKIHNHVRGKTGKRYYDLLPPGIPVKDLSCLNLYLESVGVPPCPFELLRRKEIWQSGEWRQLAKRSVLYGKF